MIDCRQLSYDAAGWTASFTFTANPGEWIGIAGPSGGGKSTLLNLMIGFLEPRGGKLTDQGRDILASAPHARQMNFMSQQNSLLAHLSCRKNLEIALHDDKRSEEQQNAAIRSAVEICCVPEHLLNRLPHELSGGELARMNLARTLLRPCKWVLLDEPFAALDADLRLKILTRLGTWHKEQGIGVFMVSHDPADAFVMADQMLFIEKGQVIAQGTPLDFAAAPKSLAMAKLLKSGSVFQFHGKQAFITPLNLFTSEEDLRSTFARNSSLQAAQIICKNWRSVPLGSSQMILDFDQDQFWLLPLHRVFAGTFWFDETMLQYL